MSAESLSIDECIRKNVNTGNNLVILGPMLVGLTTTSIRLSKLLSDYKVVSVEDITLQQLDSTAENQKALVSKALENMIKRDATYGAMPIMRRERVALFIHEYYLSYLEQKAWNRIGTGDYTIPYVKDLVKEGKIVMLKHLLLHKDGQNILEERAEKLSNELVGIFKIATAGRSLEDVVLEYSKLEFTGPYISKAETLIPALIVNAVEEVHHDRVEYKLDDKVRFVEFEVAKFEKRRKERDLLYASVGISVSNILLNQDEMKNLLEDSASMKDIILSLLPVMGITLTSSLLEPALGAAFLLPTIVMDIRNWWKRKHKKADKETVEDDSKFKGILRLWKAWNSVDKNDQMLIGYLVDQELKLKPGESYTLLSSIFGVHDFERRINFEYLQLQKGLEENSDALKKLEDQLTSLEQKFGHVIDAMKGRLDQLSAIIEKLSEKSEHLKAEINQLRREVEIIAGKLEDAALEELKNKNDIASKLSVDTTRTFVGVGSLEADKDLLKQVDEVIEISKQKLVMIIGEPGAGKSTFLYLIAKNMIDKNARVYYINNTRFRVEVFSGENDGRFAIVDLVTKGEAEGFIEELEKHIFGKLRLCRIIATCSSAYVSQTSIEKLKETFDLQLYELRYTETILRGISRMLLAGSAPSCEVRKIEDILVARCENNPLFICEAVKFLESNGYIDTNLRMLPIGVAGMILKILEGEMNTKKELLLFLQICASPPSTNNSIPVI